METMAYAPFLTCFNTFHLSYLSTEAHGDVPFSVAGRSESPKELPSRINRQRRSSERRERPLVLKYDNEHSHKATSTATTSTRCASTQTLITSEMVGIPEINPDLPIPSSSSLMSNDIPNPRSPQGHMNMPQQLLRPSVITCAPAPFMREPDRIESSASGESPVFLNGRNSDRWRDGGSASAQHRNFNIAAGVDPDIEEHFRRSLGRDYREDYSSPPPSATTPPPTISPPLASPDPNEVSITGSVDDHFAKALGDKWSQIKQVIEPTTNKMSPSSPPPLGASPQVVQQQRAPVAS